MLDGDSDEAILPGLERLANRLRSQRYYAGGKPEQVKDKTGRRGVNAFMAVRFWHDDMCCRGRDPTAHPYMPIFVHLVRAPFRDG